MFKKGYRFDFWSFMSLLSLVFFGLFLIYPVIRLLTNAFQTVDNRGVFSFQNFVRFVSTPYYRSAAWNSVKVTFAGTVLASVLGVSLAYITTKFKIFGMKTLNVIIIMSMFSPPFIGAYSWILMFGRAGAITKFFEKFGITLPTIYGFNGILLVFTLHLFIYIYMYTKGALKKVDKSLDEAAESLGDHGLKKILRVSLPLVTPTILSGAAIVFLRAFADYGTPRLIGEGYITMPVLVYNEWLSEEGGDAFFSSSIAFIMVVVAIIVFLLQMHFSRKNYNMSMLNPPVPEKIKHPVGRVVAHLYVYIAVALAFLPVAYCVMLSFREVRHGLIKNTWTFNNYIKAWNDMGRPIGNTFKYAITAIIIIVIFGTMFAYITVRRKSIFSKILDACAQLPYVISGTIFGLMLLSCYHAGIPIGDIRVLGIGGTAIIIVISYVVRRMPYTLRSSASILRQISPSIDEASASLGYGSVATFFKVTMPVMMPGIVSGAILSWITLIQELASTLMLYVPRTATITVTMFQQVDRGAYGVASALATILIIVVTLSMILFFRVTGNTDVDM